MSSATEKPKRKPTNLMIAITLTKAPTFMDIVEQGAAAVVAAGGDAEDVKYVVDRITAQANKQGVQ